MFLKSADFYDLIYCNLKNYQNESETIKSIILKNNPNAKTILNVACGTGEHDRFLKNDFDIDGIDINQKFLDISKKKNERGNYYSGDMAQFNLNKKYDAIVCLFTSIGYLKNCDQLKKTISNFSSHLNKNGVILIEPWVVPEQWKTSAPLMQSFEKDDIKICRIAQCKTEGNVSKILCHFMVGDSSQGVNYFTEEHELLSFSFEEMKDACDNCNMEISFDPIGLTGKGLYLGNLESNTMN